MTRFVDGMIVCTPLPGMLKVMVSAPGFEFADRIAWRSDPAPLSFVLMTVNVAALTGRIAITKNNSTNLGSRSHCHLVSASLCLTEAFMVFLRELVCFAEITSCWHPRR